MPGDGTLKAYHQYQFSSEPWLRILGGAQRRPAGRSIAIGEACVVQAGAGAAEPVLTPSTIRVRREVRDTLPRPHRPRHVMQLDAQRRGRGHNAPSSGCFRSQTQKKRGFPGLEIAVPMKPMILPTA